MLRFSKAYIEQPILSLRTAGQIGEAHIPLVNPTTLKIEGWFANARGEKTPSNNLDLPEDLSERMTYMDLNR